MSVIINQKIRQRAFLAACNNIEALEATNSWEIFNTAARKSCSTTWDFVKPDKALTADYLMETLDGRKLMQKFIKFSDAKK